MNKAGYTSVIAAALACVATSRADLIAHYDFESDFSNQVLGGSAGNGFNSAAAGQAGGISGNALTLGGGNHGAGGNDYFRTSTNYGGIASLTDAGTNFTISVWYKLDNPWFNSSQGPGGRLFIFEGNTDYDVSYSIRGDSNGQTFTNGGGNTIIANAGTAGVWHSVITTYQSDGGTTTVTTWVNGIKHPGTLTPPTANFFGTTGINFGVHRDEDRAFDGQLDEVKIWNNVLSDLEILDEYGLVPVEPPPPADPALIAYYSFESDFSNQIPGGGTGAGFNGATAGQDGGISGRAMTLGGGANGAGNSDFFRSSTNYGGTPSTLTDAGTNLTISVWYKVDDPWVPSSDGGGRLFVFEGNTDFDVSYSVRGNSYGQTYVNGGGNTTIDDAGSAGIWHSVITTYASEGGATTVTTWVDGMKHPTTLQTPTGNFIGLDGINFGVHRAEDRAFDGQLDEIKIWNYVLSDDDVLAEFVSVLEPPAPLVITEIMHHAASDTTELTWESSAGELFEIRKSLDLTGDPNTWPIVMTQVPAAAAPAETTTQIVDPNATEAEAFYKVFRIPPPPLFEDDFESDQGWLTVVNDANGNTVWERGAPGFPGPEGGAGGSATCFGTNLTADYGFDSDILLRSPVIDLTDPGITGALLTLQQIVDTDLSGDLGSIRVLRSSDNTQLGADIASAIEGIETDWGTFSANLPPEALGEMIRLEFQFTSNNSANFSGWYIDDVVVTSQ